MKEAEYYQKERNLDVSCYLCAHYCRIKPGKRGFCGVRENRDGTLYSLVYGLLVSQNVDPIEKKPFFHFLPGSTSFSISTVGCNFRCQHCQNYQISQYPQMNNGRVIGDEYSAAEVVAAAEQAECHSISYTYVEPTIFFEFARDCAKRAQPRGLKNTFVSNGYMTPQVTRELAGVIDAINIDIKAFTDTFYKTICRARLQPVLDSVRLMHELGVWVEITTLIIPGLNDSEAELRDIARFIRVLDPGIPWHVTAFYPTYNMTDRERTPAATLRRAREIGLSEGLHFVYEGNIVGEGGENTFCPSCGAELITRYGFKIGANRLHEGSCSSCKKAIPGVWQ